MWEVVRAYIQQEPVAAIGFILTWTAAGLAAIIKYVKSRSGRKERIAELLADAKILAKQTMFRYTKLYAQLDRDFAEHEKHNRETPAKFLKIRDECYSRRSIARELEARIEEIDVNDASHKNLLAALAAKNDASLCLTTSEEFLELNNSFPPLIENFPLRKPKPNKR